MLFTFIYYGERRTQRRNRKELRVRGGEGKGGGGGLFWRWRDSLRSVQGLDESHGEQMFPKTFGWLTSAASTMWPLAAWPGSDPRLSTRHELATVASIHNRGQHMRDPRNNKTLSYPRASPECVSPSMLSLPGLLFPQLICPIRSS